MAGLPLSRIDWCPYVDYNIGGRRMSQFSGALRTFKGGIHPPDSKKITEGKPIEDYLDPQMDLVFPMQQHIGAPCKPLVKKGDRILRGQCIGEAAGFVSSPIHSSVSGVV